MKLLTKELIKKIPKLYETDGLSDEEKICVVKLFNPVGAGTWYIIEYDAKEKIAYGLVELGHYPELGYFSIKELENIKLPLGLKIERDKFWKPQTLSRVNKAHS